MTVFPERLRVIAWQDSLVDGQGNPAWSHQAEREWLPLIGPTAMVALRRMAVDVSAGPVVYDLAALGAELGVPGQKGAFERALRRLVRFRLVALVDGSLLVRTRLLEPKRRKEAA